MFGGYLHLGNPVSEDEGRRRIEMARATKAKAKFYAVRKGYKPGIYLTWSECSEQVRFSSDWILGSLKASFQGD